VIRRATSSTCSRYKLQPFSATLSFGFNDGLSQPAIRGFDLKPFAGQQEIPSGVILLGGPGDTRTEEFAKDGSFLVFRKLAQLVPEFDDWLDSNSKDIKGGAELLGARVVGRWKSGSFYCPKISLSIRLTWFRHSNRQGTIPRHPRNRQRSESGQRFPVHFSIPRLHTRSNSLPVFCPSA
jgi:hypothetical protein